MNEIRIASILMKKRRDRGLTQEELAEYIGVSKSAVSKWEKAQSFPDIALLPQLAAYFNISVDELLGYSPQLNRVDARRLCQRLSEDFMVKSYQDIMRECREITKKFFSCFSLLYQMAVLLISHSESVAREHNNEMLEEAKALCDRIISESDNVRLVRDALYARCRCCIMLGKPEEVFDRLGEVFHTPETTEDGLISQAFQLAGQIAKAREVSQCGMYYYLNCLVERTLEYVELTATQTEVALTAFDRAMALIQLYGIEKLNGNTAARAYLYGANLYGKCGDIGKAIDLLEKYADLCVSITLPVKLQGDLFFSEIDDWLDNSELGATIIFSEKMIKENMRNGLVEIMQPYPAIQSDSRYKRIIRRLTDAIK